MTNALFGLAGEVGEVTEIFKKGYFHGKEIDRQKVIKELGDVYFYLAEACSAVDTTLDDIALVNVDKLSVRHPNGFTPESAAAKADERV